LRVLSRSEHQAALLDSWSPRPTTSPLSWSEVSVLAVTPTGRRRRSFAEPESVEQSLACYVSFDVAVRRCLVKPNHLSLRTCQTRKVPTYSLYMIPEAILDIWLKASFKYYFVVSPTRA